VRDELARDDDSAAYRAHDPELDRNVVVRVVKPRSIDQVDALLEAARAMAKLSHPSLVPIFDVGVVEDGVYLVLPELDGASMRSWIQASSPTWRDVVRRFVPATRALAAAHSAGLTHRSLSVDDIVIDGNGVFVTGFDLSSVDPAGDEATNDQKALREAMRDALVSRGSPAWLTSAIGRTWPNLAAFADHLDARMRRRRRLMLALAAAGIALGVVVAIVASSSSKPNGCPDPRSRLAGVWDGRLRVEMEAAFKRVAPSIAEGTLTRLVPALDGYANHWSTMQLTSCRATRNTRSQPEGLFDRQQACLERRLEAFRSLISTLTEQPAATVVSRADEAFATLPDIGDCERTEQLMAMAPRPTDAALRARIDAAEKDLDEVANMRIRGENKTGLERITKAVEQVRTLGYGPVLARALYLKARYEEDARLDSREATLREMAQVAAEARVDTLTALAWVRLLSVLGAGKGRRDDAHALEPVAEAAVIRAGNTPELRFELHLAAGGFHMVADNLATAERHLDAAEEIASDDRRRALAAQYRAKMTMLRHGPTVAIPLAEEALRVTENAMGRNHPLVATVLDVLSQIHVVAGDFDKATAYAQRQIEILEEVFGPLHSEMTSPLRVLAHVATMREDHAKARDLSRRALDIAKQVDNPVQLASAHVALAQALALSDGFEAAQPHYEQGLAIMERANGRDHQSYVRLENDYAAKLVAKGSCKEASPFLEHSIGFFESKRPELTALPRYLRAKCTEAAGMLNEAIAAYERADADCDKATCEPAIALSTKGALGRLLVETGKDKRRGAALLNDARAGFEAKGMSSHLAETDRMMKALGVKRR